MEDYNKHYKYTFRYNKKHISDACKHSRITKRKTILKYEYKGLTLSDGDGITYWRMRCSEYTNFSIESIGQTFIGGVNFM